MNALQDKPKSGKVLFKPDGLKARLDKIQLRVDAEVWQSLQTIPNWQYLLRRDLPGLIEKWKREIDTQSNE